VVKQLFHKSKLTGSELNDFRKEMDIIMYACTSSVSVGPFFA
jgi:maleate cis-trans isomerase